MARRTTDFHRKRIRYRATWDYGSRRGSPTLAIVFHMAEGTNVARYLALPADRIGRGVSVHYTIEQKTSLFRDGEIQRILPEGRIAGSINPDTIRRDEDRYFGASHARGALGRHWLDPNRVTISVEVAGRAREGPTAAQVRSMVLLFEDVDRRYGGRVVPLGHRDFQNVKPCPGTKPAIKRAFAEMGGHGNDHSEVRFMSTRGYATGQVADVVEGAPLYNFPGGRRIGRVDPPNLTRDYLGLDPSGDFALIASDVGGKDRTAWTKAGKVGNVRPRVTDESAFRLGRAAGLDEAQTAIEDIDRD